jgi:hypothetical protein
MSYQTGHARSRQMSFCCLPHISILFSQNETDDRKSILLTPYRALVLNDQSSEVANPRERSLSWFLVSRTIRYCVPMALVLLIVTISQCTHASMYQKIGIFVQRAAMTGFTPQMAG